MSKLHESKKLATTRVASLAQVELGDTSTWYVDASYICVVNRSRVNNAQVDKQGPGDAVG